jgi:asparagine synthase (glutamine-hydrolysing)
MVEFATSIPGHLKFRDGTGKWIFRRAIKDLVPPEVFTRPKQGFGVPLRLWFRGELRPRLDALLNPANAVYEFAEPSEVTRIVREHLSNRRDHSALIWKLLVLQGWLEADQALSRPARTA